MLRSSGAPARGVEPCGGDFLDQLETRLGLNQQAAVARLSSWIATYQPGSRALAQSGASRRALGGTAERAVASSERLAISNPRAANDR